MGSRSGKAPASSSSSPPPPPPLAVWACLALWLCLLLLLSRCSPCQGRKLLLLAQAEEEGSGTGKVVHFEGGLALRVPPPPSVVVGDEPAASAVSLPAPVPRGFAAAAAGRAARLMRSVPSPGIGH